MDERKALIEQATDGELTIRDLAIRLGVRYERAREVVRLTRARRFIAQGICPHCKQPLPKRTENKIAGPLEPGDFTDLPIRIQNRVQQMGIRKISDLAALSERDILRSPGLGRTSLRQIIDELRRHGLSLRSDSQDNQAAER